jgi:hypothetical protein
MGTSTLPCAGGSWNSKSRVLEPQAVLLLLSEVRWYRTAPGGFNLVFPFGLHGRQTFANLRFGKATLPITKVTTELFKVPHRSFKRQRL